jgi:hypothetical protein
MNSRAQIWYMTKIQPLFKNFRLFTLKYFLIFCGILKKIKEARIDRSSARFNTDVSVNASQAKYTVS